MRRADAIRRGAATAFTALAAVCLIAQQPSRDEYRSAYRVWRQAEPTLEQDAPTAGPPLAARASHAAAEENVYATTRAAFLRGLQAQHAQDVKWLQTSVPAAPKSPAPAQDLAHFVAGESAAVSANISAFAGDNDPGIQQLQRALEREQMALSGLDSAIADRQQAELKFAQTTLSLETARSQTAMQFQAGIDALGAAANSISAENAAWAAYYQKLSEGARGGPRSPLLSSVLKATTPESESANAGAPPPRQPSVAPLPLARYTGAWTYNDISGQYHGSAPEFADLVVHADNGKVTGTLFARFKLPPGSTDDPLVRFDFSGDLQPTTTQTFKLMSSDNLGGTVDLIPGTAFNLLEVNFNIDPMPGKIHQGDLLLVKK